jgi:hypothetical protein
MSVTVPIVTHYAQPRPERHDMGMDAYPPRSDVRLHASVAARLVACHYPDAVGAVLGGSSARGTRLRAAEPVLGEALLRGHRAVAESTAPEPLAAAVRQVLSLLGGPLREGYTAPHFRP